MLRAVHGWMISDHRNEYERLGKDRAFAFPSINNIAKCARPVCTEALIFKYVFSDGT